MPNLQDIIKNPNVFTIPDNGIYAQHMVPQRVLPKEEFGVCGSFICQFHNSELLGIWLAIRDQMAAILQGIEGIQDCLEIIPIERFDDISLIQERPFNEGYTTCGFSEYLTYGNNKPNEWIIQGLNDLRVKTLEIDTFDNDELDESDFENRDQIIANVVHKTILTPNSNLVWQEPWAMYLPAIEKIHVDCWGKG